MSKLVNARVQMLILSSTGQVPTVPSNPALTPESESWLATDLLKGEWAINTADEILFQRVGNDIKKIFAFDYKGKFADASALTTAWPNGSADEREGWFARVGSAFYVWDLDNDEWAELSGGGGGAWGGITGTLGDQTDLQAALDAKAAASHTHDDRYYTESELDSLLSAKAADSAVVKLTGTQSVAGEKTFTDPVHANREHHTEITASETLALDQANERLFANHASTEIELTVPPNSSVAFPVKTEIEVIRYGDADVSFVAGAGVTINSVGGYLGLSAKYAGACLIKIGVNEWVLIGNLS